MILEGEAGSTINIKGTNRDNIWITGQDFVKFKNLRFPESQTNTFTLAANTSGIQIENCIADNCNVARNNSAPGFVAPPVDSSHLGISNIFIYGCSMLSTAKVFDTLGNAAALSMGDGVSFVRNIWFASNTIEGTFWDHVGGGSGTSGRGCYENWTMEYNIHRDLDVVTPRYRDDFYEIDGDGVNCIVLRNRMYATSSSAVGISLAPVTTGPIFILGNLYNGTNYTSAILKQGGTGDLGPAYIFHNTFSAKYSTGAGGQNADGTETGGSPAMTDRTYRNNIFISYGSTITDANDNTTPPNSWNYNCYSNSQSPTGVLFSNFNDEPTNDHTSVVIFNTLHGEEANGLFADPSFDNYALGILTINSPCINAGVVITGINDWEGSPLRYQGSAPEIGYWEQPVAAFITNMVRLLPGVRLQGGVRIQ